jgi:hypothetical protein
MEKHFSAMGDIYGHNHKKHATGPGLAGKKRIILVPPGRPVSTWSGAMAGLSIKATRALMGSNLQSWGRRLKNIWKGKKPPRSRDVIIGATHPSPL